MIGALLIVASVAGSPRPAAPVPQTLDERALASALAVARGTEGDLERFHAAYRLGTREPVRSLEVVTPFRRAVTLAREHAGRTGQMPGIHGLRTLMSGEEGTLRVRAVVSLDPRHAYVRPPDYSIVLVRGTDRVRPAGLERRALGPTGAAVPSVAIGGAVAMTAIEIDAVFTAVSPRPPGCCRIVITDPDGAPVIAREIPDAIR